METAPILFWIFMLMMDMLVHKTMFWFGRRWMSGAPEKIGMLYGYRTEMSMESRDTWEFAHRYCGKLWARWGAVLVPLSAVVMLLFLGKDMETVAFTGTARDDAVG